MNTRLSGGALSGTFNDESGAVLAHTQLSVKDLATGATRVVRSDTQGFDTIPNLPRIWEIKPEFGPTSRFTWVKAEYTAKSKRTTTKEKAPGARGR